VELDELRRYNERDAWESRWIRGERRDGLKDLMDCERCLAKCDEAEMAWDAGKGWLCGDCQGAA